jgi:hypothetical protein
MAGQFTRLQKSYRIMDADGVGLYRIVKLTGENECQKTKADNELPLGVVDNDQRLDISYQASGDQTGRQVAVKLEGIALIELAETVAIGDRIVAADLGLAKSASALAAGTQANVIGFAEKGGEQGDVIPVRMAFHVFTV